MIEGPDPGKASTGNASTARKSTDTVFAARAIDPDLNPFAVAVRELRDLDLNLRSSAITGKNNHKSYNDAK